MPLLQVRVDERLVHGQVVAAWLPMLGIERLLVLDDAAVRDPLARGTMALALPEDVELAFHPVAEARDAMQRSPEPMRSMVLFRTIAAVERAWRAGASIPRLTLGNVHATMGRFGITPSVSLSPDETRTLAVLWQSGVDVEIRTLPGDPPLSFEEIRRRILDPSFTPPPAPL